MSESNARTLNTALHIVGTEARLAVALGVALSDLRKWLRNEVDAPCPVILDALDVIEKGYRTRVRQRGIAGR